jgi:hypothetical protein
VQFEFDAETSDGLDVTIADFGEVNFAAIFVVSESDKGQLAGWQAGRPLTTFDFPADMAIATRDVPTRSFTISTTGRWIIATKVPGGTVTVVLKKPTGESVPIFATLP